MIWFIRPGIASIFIPIFGIVQEWITSFDVIIARTGVIIGRTILLDVFINRVMSFSLKLDIIFRFLKFEYS